MNNQLLQSIRQVAIIAFVVIAFASCQKNIDQMATVEQPDAATSANKIHGHLQQTKTYSSDVVQKWINFDLRLLRTNASLNNYIMMQHFAYSSIALYESVVPGMPSYQTLSRQLNQMPSMPATSPGFAYHWAASANATLAAMVRNFYPSISAASKISTDSLEHALNAIYQEEVSAEIFQRSVEFGKSVAQKIFDWSNTDGSLTVHPSYVVPVGTGLWQPTPTGFLAPQNPFWGTNRPLIPGSVAASQLPPPVAYSTDPSSPFYLMVKQVYDASLVLTNDQRAQATFWRDIPGGGTHAHWLSILVQVLNMQGNSSMLDKAALSYAKMGITQSDSRISCWDSKYTYSLLRPITYIRSVMNQPTWTSFLTNPNHPEYPSAHSTFSSSASAVLTAEFGDNYHYTDHTFDFLGLPARSYNSFNAAANEAGLSRFYAGIHYLPSLTAGAIKGSRIATYMDEKINFLKY
ncbi:MAG: vanadium-dependent haloperoxidase [Chitinophagaceae bacterium]